MRRGDPKGGLGPFVDETGEQRVLPLEQLHTGIGKREYRPRHRNMARKEELKGAQGVFQRSRGERQVARGNSIMARDNSILGRSARARWEREERMICSGP